LQFGGIAGHGDGTRGDGIDADGGGEFFGENAGHEDDAGFGEGVGEKIAPTEDAADVREIDDDAVAGSGEVRSGGLGAEEGGFEIGVEGGVPGVLGGFTEFGGQEVGGAVDEDVEMAEMDDDIVDEFLDGEKGAA